MKWLKRLALLVLLIIIAAVGMAVMFEGYRGGMSLGEVPVVPPPIVENASPTQPTGDPDQALATTTSSLAPPIASSTSTTTSVASGDDEATTAAELDDIEADPVHLEVRRDGKLLVGANIGHIQLDQAGELNPPREEVGWYGPPEWSTTPGNSSEYAAVLVGHVTYDGEKDVFYRLCAVREGDTVIITYDNGQVAVFRVDADALSVPKSDIIEQAESTYKWVWQLDEPGRKISLFSCDPTQGRSGDGHSVNNWVVQATRIS